MARKMGTHSNNEELVLRRHFAMFENCGDCAVILGKLRSRNMISQWEHQQLQAERTPIERNRRCLEIAIYKVKNVPEYFEQFCSVLKSHKYFKSLVTSLAISYTIFGHERDIQEYIQIDNIVPYLEHLLSPVEICALIETSDANRNGKSRTEYFVMLLKAKHPIFIETFMECLALEDSHCPNHIELYQLLKSLVDSLQETLSAIEAPKPSAAITKYQGYLKQLYTDQIKLVAQDDFESSHIEQYINLSLITPEQTEHESDYFKAIVNPHIWLFKCKEKTCNVMLKSLSEIFDKSRVSSEVILIQGSPGSGKTTLANEICRRWATGKLIQEYLLVILLRLRDPRIADMTDITELIYHTTTCDTDFAFEASREIKYREGEGVLLVLEGWDELPDDKQKKSLFASIIAKGVFNKAGVLVTSRPSSIGSIKKIHVTRNIAILGFSEDQIEQYLTYCLPDPSESVKSKSKQKFWAQLNSHLALKSLACIPVNLSILVHVFKQSGERLPNSLTELYRKYIVLKLNHHNQRESSRARSFNELESAPAYISESLCRLGELAFYGLQEDCLTFTQEEIQKWCFSGKEIPLDYDGMGLLQIENHELSKQVYKTYTFLHRTIQEFVAAWYLKKIREQEEYLVDIFDDKAFEMVWVFYAGLTGFRGVNINDIIAARVFREKVNKFFVNTLSFGFKVVLKNTTSSEINRIATVAEEYYTAVISETVSREFLLVLTTCCAEAQNPSVCEQLSNGPLFHGDMCYIEIPESALTSQMLSSLSYCITCSGKKWKIDCPHLSEQDILNLRKCFDDQKNISGQLTSLVTYTGRNQIDIFLMLLQPQCCLAHLDLSGSNAFDDSCVIGLAETLKDNNQLYILELKNCKVSSKGVLAIAEMLTVNDTLEWLNLKGNCFTSDDLSQVLTRIKGNTSMRLMEVDESLEKDVKSQLTEFNKGRQH